MGSLLKWQTVSFLSRAFATVVGLAQSIIIVRILTPSEYGLVGIVSAVGNLTGVIKHLGLVSATTRELAHAKDNEECGKIVVSSALIRSVVAIPLALGLFFLAEHLAVSVYHHPEIITPLRIFAAVLFLQSFQEIANSVLAGRQRFKELFTFQAAIALVSLLLYIPFVYYFKINGYFWAMLAFTLVSAVILFILAARTLTWKIAWPTGKEVRYFLFSLLGLGLVLYFGKILYMLWQKMGTLYLGTKVSAAEVGFFSFATLYATKMMIVSDAVTDVNLPVMTANLKNGFDEFRRRFLTNYDKVYSLMLAAGTSALFWVPEVFHLLIGHKYDAALPLVAPLLLAFFAYGLLNLLESSVLAPAKMLRVLIFYHLILIGGTLGALFGLGTHPTLLGVSWATAFGGVMALTFLSFVCHCQNLRLWNKKTIIPTLVSVAPLLVYFLGLSLGVKIFVFAVYAGVYVWLLPRLEILDWRRFLRSR